MSTESEDLPAGVDPEEVERPGLPVFVEHAPTRTSGAIALGAGLLAALTAALGSLLSLVIALLGLGGVAIGIFVVESQRLALVGTAIVFVGLLASGFFGNPTTYLLFGALATYVTFDASQNAFSVGQQMSTETETTRGELIHAAATLAVGSLAVVAAYGVYLVSAGGKPAAAVVFLLLGAILFAWVIRSEPGEHPARL